MTLRKLHGLSALLLAAYACIHIINHLAGMIGVDTHISLMRTFRSVYRIPVVEAVLFAAVFFQVCSGLYFVVHGWRKRRGLVAWLQAGSGTYLAFFLLNHSGSVLVGRHILDLDTNFYFAAAGFHVTPFQYFFAPYYFLAVLALFIHLGCALHWHLQERSTPVFSVAIPAAVGSVVSLLIVFSLAGAFYPVQIPPEYKATYGGRS